MTEMPRYKCHKEVNALKILAIEFDEDGSAKIAYNWKGDPEHSRPMTCKTKPDFRPRFKGGEDDLGYFVVYDDGYESWSPTKAFEDGYTRIAS